MGICEYSQKYFGTEVMMHLTCAGLPKEVSFPAALITSQRGLCHNCVRFVLHVFGAFKLMPAVSSCGYFSLFPAQKLVEILQEAKDAGITNILALRGDPPKGAAAWKKHPSGVERAVDLVRLIKR
jgi:5,10-methylenetetrahydrofolate reductase